MYVLASFRPQFIVIYYDGVAGSAFHEQRKHIGFPLISQVGPLVFHLLNGLLVFGQCVAKEVQ